MDMTVQPVRQMRRDPSMAFLQACLHGHPPENPPPDPFDEMDAADRADAERIASAFCDMPQHRVTAVIRGFADLAATDLNRSR